MDERDLMILRSIPSERRICMRGKITQKRCNQLITKINELSKVSGAPIRMDINSEGTRGGMDSALRLHSSISKCRAPIYGLVSKAWSGAFVVLQACRFRVGRPTSTFWIHFNRKPILLYVWAYQNPDTLAKQAREIAETLQPALQAEWSAVEVILKHRLKMTGRSEEELSTLLHQDKLLGAEMALEWGFIDGIWGNL
jgi:ATP-dependent protease ClpP protease subunit